MRLYSTSGLRGDGAKHLPLHIFYRGKSCAFLICRYSTVIFKDIVHLILLIFYRSKSCAFFICRYSTGSFFYRCCAFNITDILQKRILCIFNLQIFYRSKSCALLMCRYSAGSYSWHLYIKNIESLQICRKWIRLSGHSGHRYLLRVLAWLSPGLVFRVIPCRRHECLSFKDLFNILWSKNLPFY